MASFFLAPMCECASMTSIFSPSTLIMLSSSKCLGNNSRWDKPCPVFCAARGLSQPEQPLGIQPEDVCLVLLADLRRLYLFQCRAMLIAGRVRVEKAAKDQPMR